MARPTTRIDKLFLELQAQKRNTVATTPGDSGSSIPALRDRITILEEILSTRQHEE